MGHALRTPFLPSVDDDLGIAVGLEDVAHCLERGLDCAKIVDAAIEDYRDGAVLIVDRLTSTRRINDC